MYLYIQILIDIHGYNQKLYICLAIPFLLMHEMILIQALSQGNAFFEYLFIIPLIAFK